MTWREEQIGDARLYLGDARDVLLAIGKNIPGRGTGAVLIADPPFSIPHKFADQKDSRCKAGKRVLSFDWDDRFSVTDIVARCQFGVHCIDAQAAFIFCGLRQATPLAEMLSKEGFTDKMAAWCKMHPPPACPGNWWPSAFTLAVYGYKPSAFFGDANPTRTNVFRTDTYRYGIRADERVEHPTQLWLPLAEYLVATLAAPRALVLDPFMGSGTTGVACAKLGRKFIGIEIEPKYFDIACRRIDEAYKQGDMFIERPKPAKQETLFESTPSISIGEAG